MLFSQLLATGLFAASCVASPLANKHVVHEKRDVLHNWMKTDVLDKRAVLPMRIALTQRNIEKGYEWLHEVSHPESEKYGQHWTAAEVAKAFAPSPETVSAVKNWLVSSGISHDRISTSQSMGWLTFDATAEEAEALLKTKYHVYEHEESGQPHVACEEYSIPAEIQQHIDFIIPTVHFDAKIKPRVDGMKKRGVEPGVAKSVGAPNSGSLPKKGSWLDPSEIITELENCDEQITPDCLRLLYEFPPNVLANPKNSYGIVEYSPQAYVPSDLDMFFANFSPKLVGSRPILDSIDGGVDQQVAMGFDYNGESDLDLEYAMTLVAPQKVTLYQTGDLVEGASFNDFLDAIDGSYCTYDGGDDPTQDATYPDPYCNATEYGCYEGPKNCGGFSATKVISTSYSYNEHDLTPFYEMRQCHEYLKLGMMGVSVLYSSGDYGVAGNGGVCIDGPGLDAPYINSTLGGRFNPSFPGTCPYITSVGATQVVPGTNLLAHPTAPEEACETVIYSGGGFSNVFPIPSYQESAVHTYFEKYPPPYTSAQYNNSQQTRGFPDLSANGANYVIAIDGNFSLVYGTSASSPTLGSILTLVNEARLSVGKSSIGFINPVAYAHPYVFNDVTKGGNQGCNTTGFTAVPGWDPVTGLGTPNFPKMLALWLSLK